MLHVTFPRICHFYCFHRGLSSPPCPRFDSEPPELRPAILVTSGWYYIYAVIATRSSDDQGVWRRRDPGYRPDIELSPPSFRPVEYRLRGRRDGNPRGVIAHSTGTTRDMPAQTPRITFSVATTTGIVPIRRSRACRRNEVYFRLRPANR